MEQIIDILIKILAAVIVGLIAYLEPKFKAWLTSKIGETKANELMRLVAVFVASAEQIYKGETGEFRKAYVIEQLQALGYIVNDEVNALIEAEVYKLNQNKVK